MDANSLLDYLKDPGKVKPQPYLSIQTNNGQEDKGSFIHVNTDGNFVQIILECVPDYHEWIKGAGADISLIRAQDDNRLVGAFLPLNGPLKIFLS